MTTLARGASIGADIPRLCARFYAFQGLEIQPLGVLFPAGRSRRTPPLGFSDAEPPPRYLQYFAGWGASASWNGSGLGREALVPMPMKAAKRPVQPVHVVSFGLPPAQHSMPHG